MIAPRTVSTYIVLCDEQRAAEERIHVRHRRPRALATASAALARCLVRAQSLVDEAEDLLAKANRYEKEFHDALEKQRIETLGPALAATNGQTNLVIDGPEVTVDASDSAERTKERTRLRTKSQRSARYRHAAMECLKQAEAAEQGADAWLTQFAKISGIYEPEVLVLDPSGPVASMTGAQRRAREAKVMAQLTKSDRRREGEGRGPAR